MDLKELGRVDPYKHWYYQTKNIPLLKYFASEVVRKGLKVDVIDVGAGSGFFSLELKRRFPNCVSRLIWIDAGYSEEEIQGGFVEKRRDLPRNICQSFVLLMDVLEHVEKDGSFLAQVRQRMIGENRFFVTVPAFDCLWSAHDVFLGHHRRYTKKTLADLLGSHGFHITCIYYLYASIFPIAWLVRKLNAGKQGHCDLKPAPPLINFCLTQIISFEAHFRKLNKYFGLTCVAEGFVK